MKLDVYYFEGYTNSFGFPVETLMSDLLYFMTSTYL